MKHCCCCPQREAFGNTTLWLVNKATGDVVWRRASGDEAGGGGTNNITLRSSAGLYLADKGVSGARRVEHYEQDGPYMDLDKAVRRSGFSEIAVAWGDSVAYGAGGFSVGGQAIDPVFWYTERSFSDPRPAIYGEFTESGIRKCGSFDGNIAGGGTIGSHEDHIPIETAGGSERCYALRFRSGGTPTNVWVINRRTWPAQTDTEVVTIPRARFTDSASGFGQPFSSGTTVYGMEVSTNDVAGNPFPSPPHILLRSWDAYTGAQIAAIDTEGVSYAQRGWIAGGNIYFLNGNRTTLYVMSIADGSILGSHSVTGMGSGTGPDFAYARPGGDFMLTTSTTVGGSTKQLQRFGPDGTEKWVRSGGSPGFGGISWPIDELTIGAFGLLDEEGSTVWTWRNLTALRAVYDVGDLVLCAGSLGA